MNNTTCNTEARTRFERLVDFFQGRFNNGNESVYPLRRALRVGTENSGDRSPETFIQQQVAEMLDQYARLRHFEDLVLLFHIAKHLTTESFGQTRSSPQ